MYHRIWSVVNVLLIIGSIIYIWLFRPHDNTLIVISQFLAQIAMILFIFNVNMYFIFLIIRKTNKREVKIRLATFSRYFMKWHIKISISSTILIVGHVLINLVKIGPVIGYENIKMLMGYTSFVFLLVTLFAGYLRHKKATGFRKKFHRITAMIFTVLFLIHMLAPI
ncbi:hypothetical protein [Neobacillus massiliamazoniensis]|uniref:Ferric oxidoreductase domain-containing protein n=1 Tax=Neobacillus massiliamazoniensis TaxID=1499688 RepID=A0A0U1NYQ4_9BACI|nr:hypothetical protein [Neobacillus massiliamazoniensis]CRK83117.1 hypothetical protein BN000_03075 [Neobacillus massiliamazoniensis]